MRLEEVGLRLPPRVSICTFVLAEVVRLEEVGLRLAPGQYCTFVLVVFVLLY